MTQPTPHRILVVDDNDAILDDYRRIFDDRDAEADDALAALERELGGEAAAAPAAPRLRCEATQVRQGADAVAVAAAALAAGQPFRVAFVDVRMPPGIDGVETVTRLWRQQPDLEVVLCTAHTDYSWAEITRRLAPRDRLVILRKPFEPIEVRQLAACLAEKSARGRAVAEHLRRAERLEALGRLAAGMAHEINTPTHYVGNNLEFLGVLIDELLVTPPAGEDLAARLADVPGVIEECREGIARIANLVRTMRGYSHMRDGGVHERCDLNHEVAAAAELTRAEYRHAAELELRLGELPPVMCARLEISQVLVNLMINAAHAIQARPPGSGRGHITVTTRAIADQVELEIADDGVGIAPEHADRVFEPFYTTKTHGEGTGQGLALARAAVEERHGGSLSFASRPGHGTRFMVRLPVDRVSVSS